MDKQKQRNKDAEVQYNLQRFAMFLFGIMMLLLGNHYSILTGPLFWFPLGMATLPCAEHLITMIYILFYDEEYQ